jgi:hypothetical protein
VLVAQVRRAFERHVPQTWSLAASICALVKPRCRSMSKPGSLSSRPGCQACRAELLAQRPLVEDEADVEGLRQRRLDLLDLLGPEAMADQRGVVDPGALPELRCPTA